MTILKYRLLVVITFFILLVSQSIDLIWKKDLVVFVSDFSTSLMSDDLFKHNLVVTAFIAMSLCYIYSFVGLLKLKAHARFVFVAIFIFLVPVYLLPGITIQSGLARLLWDIGLLMSGYLLTLMFTLPIKKFYNR